MSARRRNAGPLPLGLVLAALLCQSVAAQSSRDPHLGYAYPTGGRRGETIELTVGGQYIREADQVYLPGEGVRVEVVKWYRPLTQGEYNDLRRRLQEEREIIQGERTARQNKEPITVEEIAKRIDITEEQLKEMEIYREREADPKRQPNEQLAEEVTLRLTIAPDATIGRRELRLMTATAMSNPVWIQIDQWPEFRETEPNELVPDPAVGSALPAVVNGQIRPGDVDRFTVQARRGTKLVVRAAVRELMPYLADAVPGWFQAVLSLTDSSGRELAYSDSFHFRQDPVLYCEIPADGEYVISIRDSIYRGREDFVYRLTVGELPYVTSSFPLGARANTDVSVELQGWNLPQTQLSLKPAKPLRNVPQSFPVATESGYSLNVPLYVDRLKERFDTEPNDTREQAQETTALSVINGRIGAAGDVDLYRFEGGGRLAVHVLARRAGSPLDSQLTILDADGREVAFNDDLEDRGQSLLTHHADSHLTINLPKSGVYYLQLTDAQRAGGSEFVYRIYVTVPQPDFELRVVPSSVIARPGTTVPITVHALRSDGFSEDIVLSLPGAPAGFRLDGAVLPAGVDQIPLTLTVPAVKEDLMTRLELQGKATVRGLPREEMAVAAENMMQAFIWYHLVPAEQWNVLVNGRPGGRPPIDFPTLPAAQTKVLPRVKLEAGHPTVLPARVIQKGLAPEEIRLELREPPPGLSIEKVAVEGGTVQVTFQVDADKCKPGLKGNLILQAYSETTPPPTEENTAPEPRRRFLSYLPALPFEIVKSRGK